ncbi:MAG: STAS domain-containing protein [Bacteroidota bacterium]
MNLKVKKEQGIAIVQPEGKLTLSDGAKEISDQVKRFLDDGTKRFMINLSKVDYIDSSGIGELLALRNAVLETKGKIAILNPSPKVDEILKMTKLDTVLELFYNEFEAKASIS